MNSYEKAELRLFGDLRCGVMGESQFLCLWEDDLLLSVYPFDLSVSVVHICFIIFSYDSPSVLGVLVVDWLVPVWLPDICLTSDIQS